MFQPKRAPSRTAFGPLTAMSLALLSTAAFTQQAPTPKIAQNYGNLPLSFEANQGQSDSQVKFLSKGNGYTLFLTNQSAVLSLTKNDPCSTNPTRKSVILSNAKDLRFAGASTPLRVPHSRRWFEW